MHFYITFIMNVSMLITCAYLFNLVYKHILKNASYITKQLLLVVTFIFTGWLAMIFGVQLPDGPVFDLRAVPIIVASLLFNKPRYALMIGLGIAASRFAVNGMTANAMTGSINIAIMGIIAAGLIALYKRKKLWTYRLKATISLLSVNIVQVTGIALFGALRRDVYLTQIMPYTLPLAVLLGAFFLFIIHDFYKEQLRAQELRDMNRTLILQTLELLEAKRELEERARQLAKASQYKSDFMYNMSHELRTPLNSIILLSQLIRENEWEREELSENGQYADIIHTSSTELLRIINDILDLSKVEAGKMDIEWGQAATRDLTQLLYHQLYPIAAKKGLAFVVEIGQEVPEVIYTDGLRLAQILRNLLSNAVKFTEQGSVSLKLSMDQTTGWFLFEVEDTGIGIDEANRQLVFEAFQQEDGAVSRKYEGTGLGLAISLQLARLLGGDLTLASEKGKGSLFTLKLPAGLQTEESK
ncbi:sensor histidine kinase [Paenibacillus sp. N4]|uniref:ATP-binding protein n=1 Tax=Paenibacillus vietnamensis TaxID=2590547 RepID=UPI001CD07714|nr:ATP-binding protein [Paenibacillus vietnamensis]MCA0757643.1 sensor histidine kinase [Paenibacillus vietnamensis]